MQTYEERIREIRSDLSPSFEVLANFLLDSFASASFLTATELAYSLDLDPATVVRFAQKLGYAGYPELQSEIQQRVKDELLAGRPAEVNSPQQAADAALEEVERYMQLTRRSFPIEAAEALVNALDEAERVVLVAEGLGVGPARSLGAWLEGAGYTVQLGLGGLGEIARALVGGHRKDIAIAVEVENQASVVARALAEARRAGLRTAALVSAPSALSTNHADFVLAGYASPDPGVGQVVVESIVYALVQLLRRNRPGRFSKIQGQVGEMRQRIAGESR
jgi:DNA-binding MurR/RpiR family transcriptional regulator